MIQFITKDGINICITNKFLKKVCMLVEVLKLNLPKTVYWRYVCKYYLRSRLQLNSFYDHFQHMILINVSGNVFLHTIPK